MIPEIWILLFYGNAIGQGIVNVGLRFLFKNMLFVMHLILFRCCSDGHSSMENIKSIQTQELELCLKAFGVLGISPE